MTETDTEDGEGSSFDSFGEHGSSRLESGGITGTVRNEETVERFFVGREVVVIVRDDLEFDSSLREAPDLVVLHSDVDAENSKGSTGRVLKGSDTFVGMVKNRFLGRNGSDEVVSVRVVVLERVVGLPPIRSSALLRSLLPNAHPSNRTSSLAKLLRQVPRVDTIDRRNALLLEPVTETSEGLVVGEIVSSSRIVCDDQTSDVNLVGLELAGEIFRVRSRCRSFGYTVRSNERVGENEDLSSVRRIGE